jgi:large subunit ribosomal protein L31
MKPNIHPEVHEITARCACGNAFRTSSTLSEIEVSICSACHPFYTGAQKFVDTAGRIEKFEKRFKKAAGKTSKK